MLLSNFNSLSVLPLSHTFHSLSVAALILAFNFLAAFTRSHALSTLAVLHALRAADLPTDKSDTFSRRQATMTYAVVRAGVETFIWCFVGVASVGIEDARVLLGNHRLQLVSRVEYDRHAVHTKHMYVTIIVSSSSAESKTTAMLSTLNTCTSQSSSPARHPSRRRPPCGPR